MPCVVSRVARSFFDQLKEAEAGKPQVGSIHAMGHQPGNKEQEKNDDWECYKCNTNNFKQSIECTKCKAMRKLW